jgi:SAM-dependent methyltransferase
MNRFRVMYRLGVTPWERRDVEQTWRSLLEGLDGPATGRALDVGCGSGRDAVHLAKLGWQVTAVDAVEQALESARRRAEQEGVEVNWTEGDVGRLAELGLEPGFTLLYDFGCIHGLPDEARRGAAHGLTQLAATGATLLLLAFKAGRRVFLPRGMDEEEILALLGDAWELQHVEPQASDDLPPPIRRAEPTLYRLVRRG